MGVARGERLARGPRWKQLRCRPPGVREYHRTPERDRQITLAAAAERSDPSAWSNVNPGLQSALDRSGRSDPRETGDLVGGESVRRIDDGRRRRRAARACR